MRSHIEFRSQALLDGDSNDGGSRGESVARLLSEQLAKHGYVVNGVAPEDWGWRVDLSNVAFPLWIGCGHYEEYPDGHLCFIEPSKPHVRHWLKRVPTNGVTEPLATAIEQVLRADSRISDLRWWSGAEANIGRS